LRWADPDGDEILMRNRRFVIGKGLRETTRHEKCMPLQNLGLSVRWMS